MVICFYLQTLVLIEVEEICSLIFFSVANSSVSISKKKKIMIATYSYSVLRWGGRIRTSELPITSPPALPTELHVEVSLSKILTPKVAPDVQLAPCVAATAISKGPALS